LARFLEQKKPMINEEKLRKGQKLAEKAIFLEAGLAAAKGVIGAASGSVVLISDAIHSASDLLSIFTSWLGLKIAQKKADERFPYGYYKAENLGSAIISFLIIWAFWGMFNQGYHRLFTFGRINLPFLALGISLLDALVLFFFGRYEIKIGRQVGAQSLIAMGRENRTHLFSSLAVFLGILATEHQLPYFEGLVTMGIALLILKIGLETLKNSVLVLMDISPGKEIEAKVAAAIRSVSGIEEVFDLRLRKAGPFVFGEVKVGIRRFVDVRRAHEIANRVETVVKRKVGQVDSLSVRIEPFKSDYHHLVIPVKDRKDFSSSLASRFGRAPWFLFINLKKRKIKGHYFLKNPYLNKKVRAGLAAAKLVALKKSGILITSEIGEIAFHALRNELVDIYQTRAKTAREAIGQFKKGNLKILEKPTQEKDS